MTAKGDLIVLQQANYLVLETVLGFIIVIKMEFMGTIYIMLKTLQEI